MSKRRTRRTGPAAARQDRPGPAAPASTEKDGETQPWWKRTRTKIAAAVAVVLTAALGPIITATVNHYVRPAPPMELTPIPGTGLKVAIEVIPRCGQSYALPARLDPNTGAAGLLSVTPQNGDQLAAFVQTQHGAPADSITLELVFTGESQRRTRILDVEVALLQRTANLSGTALHTPCEGDPPTRVVDLDLDKPPRELVSDSQPYFASRDLDVTVEERETLRIFAFARKNSYRWIFAIRYVGLTGQSVTGYLGTDGLLRTTPEQVPVESQFSVTGSAGSYGVEYKASGDRFYLTTG